MPPAPPPDWRSALAALDACCVALDRATRDWAAARTPDLDAALASARAAAAHGATVREAVAALAGAAGEPEPAWADRIELGAALEALAARAEARADRGRERVRELAAALRTGRVVNKFTGRTNPRLDSLREPAATELDTVAETPGLTFPGPEAGDWLEWVWAHRDQFGTLLDSLRDRFSALCELLEAIDPEVWVRGAPPVVPPLPPPVPAPVAEAKPAPIPVAVPPPKPPSSGERKISVKSRAADLMVQPARPRAFAALPPVPPPAPAATLPPLPLPPVAPSAPEAEIPVAERVEPDSELEPLPDLEPLPIALEPLPEPVPLGVAVPEVVAEPIPSAPPEPDEPPVQPGEIEALCVRAEYLQAALLAFARDAAGAEPVGVSGRAALVAHHVTSDSHAAPWPEWCAAGEAAHAVSTADAQLVYLAAQCQAAGGGPDPLAADAAGVLLAAFNDHPPVRRWLDALASARAVPGLIDRLRARGSAVDPRAEYAKHRAAFLEHTKRANKITDRGAYHNRQDQFLNRHEAAKRLLALLGPTIPSGEVRGENRDIEAFLAQAPDEVTRQWLQSTNVTLNRNQPKVLADAAATYLRLASAAWHAARVVASQQGFTANLIEQHRAALDKLREPARGAARGQLWAPVFGVLVEKLRGGGTP